MVHFEIYWYLTGIHNNTACKHGQEIIILRNFQNNYSQTYMYLVLTLKQQCHIRLYLHVHCIKANYKAVILHTTWKLKFLSKLFSRTSVNLELCLSPTSFWVTSESSLSFFIPENPKSVAMCLSSCILVRIILSCLRYRQSYINSLINNYTSLPTCVQNHW